MEETFSRIFTLLRERKGEMVGTICWEMLWLAWPVLFWGKRREREIDRERNAWMPRRLTPQSTVNDFQWRLDVSITLWLAESDADIRTNGQWESAKCSRCAFNPVNTSGVYWGFHPAITVNDGTYETLFIRRVCSLHRSCKYSVARWRSGFCRRGCGWRLSPTEPIFNDGIYLDSGW